MRKLTFVAIMAAMTLLSAPVTSVLADTSTSTQQGTTTVTGTSGSTESGDGTVVIPPTTTTTTGGDVASCGSDQQGTDGSGTDSTGTGDSTDGTGTSTDGSGTSTSTDGSGTSTSTDGSGTSTSTDGSGTSTSTDGSGTSTSTDGTATSTGGTLTLNVNLGSNHGWVSAGNTHSDANKGDEEQGKGHGNGNGNVSGDDQTDGTSTTDTQSGDSTACHGKHKGWSKKIQNILKHLQDMQSVPGDLQSQLDTLMQWAETQGSATDVQALQDIEAALQAQASSSDATSQDLQLLATTQDNLNDVNGSITTLETAIKSDQSNKAVATQLANQYAKKGDKTIKVFVKGQKPNFDVTPTLINGRTMVPLRAIGDALNAKVQWDANTSMITLSNQNGTVVQLKSGSKVADVNGTQVTLDSPATVQNGRTLVPLRALGNFFGLNVDWYQNAQMAVLD